MGFRDLECFNVALLTKQAWRLVTVPETLLARIIKARYFPRANFLTAEVGERPSLTWRSILRARSSLESGLRRRIGNGLMTSIWGDNWLASPSSGRIITRRSHASPFPNKLADLIYWSSWSWNFEMIFEIFWPVDTYQILQLPLG